MQSLLRLACMLAVIAGCLPLPAAGSPVVLNADSLRPRFSTGIPPELQKEPPQTLLSLHLITATDTATIAVAASWSRNSGRVEMQPMTELDYDSRYLLRWRDEGGTRTAVYRTPPPVTRPAARLRQRFPAGDTVPENLLFLQFRFDKPMRPDIDAWALIHIRADSPGSPEIRFAWRQRCFWLDSSRVLQLMVHPGRVKNGIDYGGPLFVAGTRYVLTIDSGLVDADRNTLPSQAPQYFTATSADTLLPALRAATAAVAAGSCEPVELQFSEPMDCSGLLTGIRILDRAGQQLRTVAEPGADGRICRVRPVGGWPRGMLRLELDAEIRDLGANTLRRRFEIHDAREAACDKVPVVRRIRSVAP